MAYAHRAKDRTREHTYKEKRQIDLAAKKSKIKYTHRIDLIRSNSDQSNKKEKGENAAIIFSSIHRLQQQREKKVHANTSTALCM